MLEKYYKKRDSGDSEASVETDFSSGDVEAEFRLFSLASVEDGQETWAMHTNGTVKYNPQGGDVPPSVMPASYMKEVMERCPKTMDQKTFYQRMWDREYHLGKHFQWVGDVQYGDREGYSLFRAPMDAYETEGFEIFPGLIDAAFQLVAATFFDNVSGTTYIPFQIAGFYYYQKPDPKRRLWVHAKERFRSEDGQVLHSDVNIMYEDGSVVASVVDLNLWRGSNSKVSVLCAEGSGVEISSGHSFSEDQSLDNRSS